MMVSVRPDAYRLVLDFYPEGNQSLSTSNVPVLNVINLTDGRADPKRFLDISASNVFCIDTKIQFPDRYFLLAT